MLDDPLYMKIKKALMIGDRPRTAKDIATSFDRSERQAIRVLEWMSNIENPPSMAGVPNTNPKEWRRI